MSLDAARVKEATQAQRRAVDPRMSVWVSASAGSGKTEVLTQRILALLLTDETLTPGEILALTFTRAGAGEMAERLPRALRAWADEDDAVLEVWSAALGLGVDTARARLAALEEMVAARPPVVTTIHGLGQMLVTAFPLEARIAVGAAVMEEGEQEKMLEEIQHALLTRAEGALAEHLGVLLDELGEHGWRELTGLMVKNWRRLRATVGEDGVAGVLRRLDEGLGLTGDEGWVGAPVLPRAEEVAALRTVAEILPDHKAAAILRKEGVAREAAWRGWLLTQEDEARSSLFVKKEKALVGEAVEEVLRAAQRRVAEQVRLRKVLRGHSVTEALVVWAAAVKAEYAARKDAAGLLDYDDMLDGLERLLAQAEGGMADYIWYMLDRRFAHLLVDEAQDNNAQQDRVVRTLMRNILSGDVGGDAPRSVMAVGDAKQSVFRFQGAEPGLFIGLSAEMQRWAGQRFREVSIRHSFRSGPDVLAAVDAVFGDEALAREVQGHDGVWLKHVAVAKDRPGRVEVWPLVGGGGKAEAAPWALPQARFEAGADGDAVRCMREVGAWLQGVVGKVQVPSAREPRVLAWEDVMVVVQRNRVAGLAAGVWRGMGIPVASATGVVPQLVLDVVALARAVFNPRDRIALATVLKGLRGWSDTQLLALAARAQEGDWHAALAPEDAAWLAEFGRLAEAPLSLVQAGMRAAGGGAAAFRPLLEWAERAESLAALVARLEREELPAAGGGQGLRILTAHGAKGLQAPLVVLPDTMARMGDASREKVLWGEGVLLFRQGKGISDFEDGLLEEEASRQRADSLRALYVAMTRAADWLVVTGWGKDAGKETWWGLVDAAAKGSGWREEDGKRVLGGL